MKLAQIKLHFTSWRDWELNPIVLKELRQAVRSWAVTGMLLIFLLALFVVSLGFLVSESFQVGGNEDLGASLFGAFLVVLAAAGILFIPLYTGLRVAAERQDNNPDLLYISTLSPGRIIRGKFYSGAYVTFLFFSVCLPFMALTNLLRGVDLPTVFLLLAFLFVLVCLVILGAIFIACLPISKLFKIVLGLAGLLFLFFVLTGAMGLAFGMMATGVGSRMFQRDLWEAAASYLFFGGATGGLFYVLAVALISPPSANRALVPRLYVSGFWLASGVVSAIASVGLSQPELMFMWVCLGSILLVMVLLVTISNHDHLSVRVRRTIPQRGRWRLPAFCFYNGAAGGLVWITGLIILTYLAMYSWGNVATSVSSTDLDYFSRIYPAMALYFLAYALLGLFLQRRLFPRFAPKIAGVFAVFITALTALAPSIFLFFANKLSLQTAEHLELGNAFNLIGEHDDAQRLSHLICASSLFVIALILNAKWFHRQWTEFRPPGTGAILPLSSVSPPAAEPGLASPVTAVAVPMQGQSKVPPKLN